MFSCAVSERLLMELNLPSAFLELLDGSSSKVFAAKADNLSLIH